MCYHTHVVAYILLIYTCILSIWSYICNHHSHEVTHIEVIHMKLHPLSYVHVVIYAATEQMQDIFNIIEPRREKTGFLHMRKQRRRSAPLFSLHR